MGGLFALIYAAVRGRLGPDRQGPLALLVAGGLFVGAVLVPFLKYPANPPAVGDPDTIATRTILYLVMIAISLLAMLAAARIAQGAPGSPGWLKPLAGVGTFVMTVGVAFAVLPADGGAPDGFPPNLLWDFRLASLAVQLTLWSVIGSLFAVVVGGAREG